MKTCCFLLILILSFKSSVSAIQSISYQHCKEYVYEVKAKTKFVQGTETVLKAKIGFDVLNNSQELLTHIHNARMQQGIEEVDLHKVMDLDKWFSIRVNDKGEVTNVFYPPNEDYNAILFKKTIAGYISGRFELHEQNDTYKVHETGGEGLHEAHYTRSSDELDLIFVKQKLSHHNPVGSHADRISDKTTRVSHHLRVPRKIIVQEKMKAFHKVHDGFLLKRPPIMGRNGNLEIDSESENMADQIPGIHFESSGEAELIDLVDGSCEDVERPYPLVEDTLEVTVDGNMLSKEDYEDSIEAIFEQLDGNFTCVRRNTKLNNPRDRYCFENILNILQRIPDENIADLAEEFFIKKNETLRSSNLFFDEDRLIMIDALGSLQTEMAQMILHIFVLNDTNVPVEILHRTMSHFMSFTKSPLPIVVKKIEEIALTALTPSTTTKHGREDFQRGFLLIYGGLINILHKYGNSSEKARALIMVEQLENRVGYHDPYHWHEHRRKRSVAEYSVLEREKANAILALGNAAMKRSFELIVSHLNHSETPYTLKRAGLHAAGIYEDEDSAEILLRNALFEEESTLRYDALKLYLDHPRAQNFYRIHKELEERFNHGSFPNCPKDIADEASITYLHHERVKRSVWKGFQFHLSTPTLDWAKRYGNNKLGASMGLKVQNELDIDIKLQSGHVKVNIDNHAYCIGHVGLMGINLKALDAKLCLIGELEYELNLLQEFGFDEVEEFVKYWDRFQNGVVKKLKQGVEKLSEFMKGVKDFSENVKNLDNTLKEIPDKVRDLRKISINSIRRLGEIDKESIPQFAKPLIRVYFRIIKLYSNIKSDVMDFYNKIVDIVKVQIPMSWRQIQEGVFAIGQSFKSLFKSPKEAIAGIFKAIFKIKLGVQSLLDAQNRTIDACFFLKDEKPYWWDLTGELDSISHELSAALKIFRDPNNVKPYLNGKVNEFEREMRHELVRMIDEMYLTLTAPFKNLRKLAFPFVDAIRLFTSAVQDIRDAYIQLKSAYEEARTIVDRLFGTKAYIQFPRKIRTEGGGCSDSGIYPVTSGYGDPGVDLEAAQNKELKCPFDGYLERISENQVSLSPDGSSFADITIYITNVKMKGTEQKIKVFKSDIIGTVTHSNCKNHIHVSMKENGQYIDPTRFLEAKKMKTPKWVQKCDEYYVIYLGRPILAGSILKSKEEENTSPKRSTNPPDNVDVPKTEPVLQRFKRDSKPFNNDWNKIKNTLASFFDLPTDLGLDKFFKKFSIRSVRLGTMIGLLDQMGMDESKRNLTSLIKTFIMLSKSAKCYRPEQMTDDQLKIELRQRGLFLNGTREAMIEAFYTETSQCSLWKTAFPGRSFCQFDKKCLSVECCLDYKLGIFYKSMKIWVRLDPCKSVLLFGLDIQPIEWRKSITLIKGIHGSTKEFLTGLRMNLFSQEYELKITHTIRKNDRAVLFDLSAALCKNKEKCLPEIIIVRDMILPIPTCKPDGTVVWSKIDLYNFFNLTNIRKELLKIPTNMRESIINATNKYIEKELGLPAGFLSKPSYCDRPSRMTASQMRTYLGLKDSDKMSMFDLKNFTSNKMRTCEYFTLPEILDPVGKQIFCRISSDCFHVTCCIEISIKGITETVAINSFAKFDPCRFTFSYGFQHWNQTELLLDYEWGNENQLRLGAFHITYSLGRTPDNKYFQFSLGWGLCLGQNKAECIFNEWILKQHRIPVPICNKEFENCFTSVVPIRSLMDQGVKAVTKSAIRTVLRCLDLEKFLNQSEAERNNCAQQHNCGTGASPRILRLCQPHLPCWTLSCSIDLNLFVATRRVCTWIGFNPCSYQLEVGIGTWNYTTNLMRMKFGQVKTVLLGDVLKVVYSIKQSPNQEFFQLSLGYAVCYKGECTGTQFIMSDTKIIKPLCGANFTSNLPGGSMKNFIEWVTNNSSGTVGKLAIDRALDYLGIKQCLSDSHCLMDHSVTINGWDNQCDRISNLATLPSNLICQLGVDCSSIKCCFNFDIKIWKASLEFSYSLNIREQKMSLQFESCRKEVDLLTLNKMETISFHPNVNFSYQIDETKDENIYLLTFFAHICDVECGWLPLLNHAEFDISNYTKQSDEKKLVRRKRGIHIITLPDTVLVDNDPLLNKLKRKVPGLLNKVSDLVQNGKMEFEQEYAEIQEKMSDIYSKMYGEDAESISPIVRPKSQPSQTNTRDDGSVLAKPGPKWDWQVITPSGGAELFKIQRGPPGELMFVVGEGLTQSGRALLGDALANMTIAELEATLDFDNVDPIVAFQLVSQLREFYFKLVSEAIDVFFGGKMDDKLFDTFDYVMKGTMQLPKVQVQYFEYSYSFFVFPVPCIFTLAFGAKGYWGVNFYMQFELISMIAKGTIDPYVGLLAYGSASANCVVFKGTLQLNGYILETHLPCTAEIGFYKFPLDIGLNMDLVVYPLRFELIAEVQMRQLFFLKRRKRWRTRIRIRVRVRRIVRGIKKVVRFVGKVVGKIIKLVQKVFKWKTLFRKVLWEWGMSPYRVPGIIQRKRKRNAPGPPQFNPPPTTFSQRSLLASINIREGCTIEQLSDRDPLDPAMVLRADPVDEVSKVKMFFSVDKTPGGTNVINNDKFTGPVLIMDGKSLKKFPPGVPLYFTLTAKNSEGLTSQTTCVLPTFDVTPPEGDIITPFTSTSDPTQIKIKAILYEDSKIEEVLAGFGYGPEIGGDNIVQWHKVDFYRLVGNHPNKGKRYSVEVKFTNLLMRTNQLHFVNLFVRNSLNYIKILSSKAILTDFTPPVPHDITGIQRDHFIKDNCLTYTLNKWAELCPAESEQTVPNHRLIIDGYKTKTLFNGNEALTDLRWTLNNQYLSANFEPFTDLETSILGYAMCFGREMCECDVFEWFDPHEHSENKYDWTYKGYVMKPERQVYPDGNYFVSIRALNSAQYGGPYATTFCHSRPLVVDTTPPVIEFVGKVRYRMKEKELHLQVATREQESALKDLRLGAGVTKYDLSLAPLKIIRTFGEIQKDYSGDVKSPLIIPDGKSVFLHLVVTNRVDLAREYTTPRPFLVDSSPPLPGSVSFGDGEFIGRKYFGTTSELCVSWKNFNDPESGISHYDVGFRTCLTCKDFIFYSDLANHRKSICVDKTSAQTHLIHKNYYFVYVKAYNGGHAALSTLIFAINPAMFDSTAPISGRIFERSSINTDERSYDKDIFFISQISRYEVQWKISTDPESGISAYNLHVNRFDKKNQSGPTKPDQTWLLHLPTDRVTYTLEGLHLQHGDFINSQLTSINGANLKSESGSTGVTVDLTPPIIDYLRQGHGKDHDQIYQHDTNQIDISYSLNDPESGIQRVSYEIMELSQGQSHMIDTERTKRIDGTRSLTENYTLHGLVLTPGRRYTVRVTARNQAQLTSVTETMGVIVDNTPPQIQRVSISNPGDSEAEIHDEVIIVHSREYLDVEIVANDPESGIQFYYIAVGSNPGGEDIETTRIFTPDTRYHLTNLTLPISEMKNGILTTRLYLSVWAKNRAGIRTTASFSSGAFAVVKADDVTGQVYDGPDDNFDITFQINNDYVSAYFDGFESNQHGLNSVEYGVGNEPGWDNVVPYTSIGLLKTSDTMGAGQIHLPVTLKDEEKYHVTVRTITGAEKLLESSSSGFVVNKRSPNLETERIMGSQSFTNATKITYLTWPKTTPIQWQVNNQYGNIVSSRLKISQYPHTTGGNFSVIDGDSALSTANQSHVYTKTILIDKPGVPYYMEVDAYNDQGLSGTASFMPVVLDSSAPILKEVKCDPVVNIENEAISCDMLGLMETESSLKFIDIEIVETRDGAATVLLSQSVDVYENRISWRIMNAEIYKLPKSFYIRVQLENSARLKTTVFSNQISTEKLPRPIGGVLVELGDFIAVDYANDDVTNIRPICETEEECLSRDSYCQVAMDHVTIAWTPFIAPGSMISKYEVCLGSSAGLCDVVVWTEVNAKHNIHTFRDIDFASHFKIYSSVRGFNEAGNYSTLLSNGISVSYLARGVELERPIKIEQGQTNSNSKGGYHSDPMVLPANWDLSGEHCTMKRVEWAVQRVDGVFVQNFTDVTGQSSGILFGLNAQNGDSFHSILRLTSSYHDRVYLFRSSGVTIQLEPLIPGRVYDGSIKGHDLSLQSSTDTLCVNWQNFQLPKKSATHSGNPDDTEKSKPRIDFYMVGIGSDRRVESMLNDVVDFHLVPATNSSVCFNQLELNPNIVYYSTVKAYSRWFSMTQATSTGIRVGQDSIINATSIDHIRFTNNSNFLNVTWQPFETNLAIQFYRMGVRTTYDTEELSCEQMMRVLSRNEENVKHFDIRPLTAVPLSSNSQTIQLNHLLLQDNTNYTVELLGVNTAGKCAKVRSWFFTDFTPPLMGVWNIESQMSNTSVVITRRHMNIALNWTGFIDPQSGVSSIKFHLLAGQQSCSQLKSDTLRKELNQVTLTSGDLAIFILDGSEKEFEIDDVDMQWDIPYYVELICTNQAGGFISILSSPIILETVIAESATIRMGDDFTDENLFINPADNVTYGFLHQMSTSQLSKGKLLEFTSKHWSSILSSGLHNTTYPWVLLHNIDSAPLTGSSDMEMSLERLIDREGVSTGGVVNSLSKFDQGGVINFRMRSAPGPYVETSFLLWDGPDNMLTGYEKLKEESDLFQCACCLSNDTDVQKCNCDCAEFLKTTTEPSLNPTELDSESDWKIKDIDENSEVDIGKNLNDKEYNACGIDIFNPDDGHSIMRLWCRSRMFGYKVELMELQSDPSSTIHSYSFQLTQDLLNSWEIVVSLDNKVIVELTSGVPSFAPDTKIAFHLISKRDALPPITDPFKPYKVTALISTVLIPNEDTHLLQYGKPYYWDASTPVTYYSRLYRLVSNTSEEAVTSWKEVVRPCVPCLSGCSILYCDSQCESKGIQLFTETLYNINMTHYGQRYNSTRFLMQVRAVTAGGLIVQSKSDPILLDSSPPELDEESPWMYYDAASNEPFTAVMYQASNDTIKLQFGIKDPDSGIEGYQWCIGTVPGEEDILPLTDIDKETIVQHTGLSLSNNVTYYASVAALNGAGLFSFYSDGDGVTVLCEPPSVDNLNVTVPGAEAPPSNLRAPDTLITKSPDVISIKWEKPEDPTAVKAEFCVGSEPGKDDIINCLPIDRNQTEGSKLTFRDGYLEKDDEGPVANMSDLIIQTKLATSSPKSPDQYAANEHYKRKSGLHLEPGKHLNYELNICNAAMKCQSRLISSTTVMSHGAKLLTAPERNTPNQGVQFSSDMAEFTETAEHHVIRKRATAAYNIELKLDSIEPPGTSVIYGVVGDPSGYNSDGVVSYKSYIVDPAETLSKTSRFLKDRIRSVIGRTFYISPLAQSVSLSGPIIVKFEVGEKSLKKGDMFSVIYWNTEESIWKSATDTCGQDSLQTDDEYNFQFKLCQTQNQTPERKSYRSSHFNKETQFALISLSQNFANHPPILLTKANLVIEKTQDRIVAIIPLKAEDPDGDPFKWFLTSPLPLRGEATLNSSTGILTYRPRVGAVGHDVINIKLRDRPVVASIPPAESEYSIQVTLRASVNYPSIFIVRDNEILTMKPSTNHNLVQMAHFGFNEHTESCYEPLDMQFLGLHLNSEEPIDFKIDYTGHEKYSGAVVVANNSHRVKPFDREKLTEFLPNPPQNYEWYLLNISVRPQPDVYPAISFKGVSFITKDRNYYAKELRVEVTYQKRRACPFFSWWQMLYMVLGGATLLIFFVVALVVLRKKKLIFNQNQGVEMDKVKKWNSVMTELVSTFQSKTPGKGFQRFKTDSVPQDNCHDDGSRTNDAYLTTNLDSLESPGVLQSDGKGGLTFRSFSVLDGDDDENLDPARYRDTSM